MSRTRPKKIGKPQTDQTRPLADAKSRKSRRDANAKWWREAIESIVVAIVLALLFRTFEAEAFVIPTGSMAPTLQGRHKDITCTKCGFQYQAGASAENEVRNGPVEHTTCPICRYTMPLELGTNRLHGSFTGDRILVNKFAYQFGRPERWDVIVFKFPGNAKQNYIKRLVGLPGETLRLWCGDVYTKQQDGEPFRIARKRPRKLLTMLQPIHDTEHIPQQLIDADWPPRWAPAESHGVEASDRSGWTSSEDRKTYEIKEPPADRVAWLSYRHIVPTREDWQDINAGRIPRDAHRRMGQLVTDFYAYNACIHRHFSYRSSAVDARLSGMHWVGDLAFELEFELHDGNGAVYAELVEGGRHYQCQIDVASGAAELSIDGGAHPFESPEGSQPILVLNAQTKVRGPGRYRIRMANVDDQLTLWINNCVVPFDGHQETHSGAYVPTENVRPRWSEDDPGDLAPAGFGAKGVHVTVSHLRVLRDVYYVATSNTRAQEPAVDYRPSRQSLVSQSESFDAIKDVHRVFNDPRRWESSPIFDMRRHEDFALRRDPADPSRDQFFPMGDNSPQSKDARLWHSEGTYTEPPVDAAVERRLLTGKAFLIYWPHPWYGVAPNVKRMGLIR